MFKMAAPTGEHVLFAWGANSHGQLGLKHTEDQLQPKQLPDFSSRVLHLTGGGGHSLVITDEHQLLSCGNNDRGQLGRPCEGATDHCEELKPVVGLTSKKIATVSAGWDHSVAVTSTGQVYTWGSNAFGQLGHQDTCIKTSATPVLVDGIRSSIKEVTCGLRHTVALTVEGDVYTCGFARKGQLGIEPKNEKMQPKISHFQKVVFPVGDDCITQVSAGSGHSVALSERGSVYVWGDNRFGQLAHDPAVLPQSNTPVRVPPEALLGQNICEIHCGWAHIVCKCSDGSLVTWGRCDYGQLGDSFPQSKFQHSPHTLRLHDQFPVQLACGSEHNLILSGEGSVMSWGWNEHGMCGTGTDKNVTHPLVVLCESKPYVIGCGYGHSLVCCYGDS